MKINRFRPRVSQLDNWWFSCRMFTVKIRAEQDGTIRGAAPIIRKFIGQTLRHLERWAEGEGWGKVEQVLLCRRK